MGHKVAIMFTPFITDEERLRQAEVIVRMARNLPDSGHIKGIAGLPLHPNCYWCDYEMLRKAAESYAVNIVHNWRVKVI